MLVVHKALPQAPAPSVSLGGAFELCATGWRRAGSARSSQTLAAGAQLRLVAAWLYRQLAFEPPHLPPGTRGRGPMAAAALLQRYLALLHARPLATNMVSGVCLAAVGDITCQAIENDHTYA